MARAALRPRAAARAAPAGLDLVHYAVTVPIPATAGPRVVTLHDVQHHDLPQLFSRAERAYRRWAYDGSARRADVVVTASDYSKQRIVERLGIAPERVEAVHLGIDHDRFAPGRRRRATQRGARGLDLPERLRALPGEPVAAQEPRAAARGAGAAATTASSAWCSPVRPTGASSGLRGRARRAGRRSIACGHLGHVAAERPAGALPARDGARVPEPVRGFRRAAARGDGLRLPGRGVEPAPRYPRSAGRGATLRPRLRGVDRGGASTGATADEEASGAAARGRPGAGASVHVARLRRAARANICAGHRNLSGRQRPCTNPHVHAHARYLAVVPAYNEAETVGSVVNSIHVHAPQFDVLVVDDGSTDATGQVAQAVGARVVRPAVQPRDRRRGPVRVRLRRRSTTTTTSSRSTATASTAPTRSRSCSPRCATDPRSTWSAGRAS